MKQLKINLKANDVAEVLLYDQIGAGDFFSDGISAKDFRDQIKSIKAKTINLRINSPGGSVIEGATMLAALDEFPGRIEVDIDGLAASAATFVMMAGDTIRAASNALVMIHNPYGGVLGGADDMRRTADLLDKITEQILDNYARKAKISRDQLRAAMAAETWYTGKEAMGVGLVDSVTEPVNIAAFAGAMPILAKMKCKHIPAPLRSQMDAEEMGCCFEVGDRVIVATGAQAGIIRQVVSGPAYGIEFDGTPGKIDQWWVGSDIMLEDPLEEETEPVDPAMPDARRQALIRAKQAQAAAWAETERRKAIAAKLCEAK